MWEQNEIEAAPVVEDMAAMEADIEAADEGIGPGFRARFNFVKRGNEDSPPSPKDKLPIVKLFAKDEKSSDASKFVLFVSF